MGLISVKDYNLSMDMEKLEFWWFPLCPSMPRKEMKKDPCLLYFHVCEFLIIYFFLQASFPILSSILLEFFPRHEFFQDSQPHLVRTHFMR